MEGGAPGAGRGGAHRSASPGWQRGLFTAAATLGCPRARQALGRRDDVPDMTRDVAFLSFVETSVQMNFSMTVKVDGVAEDGTTKFIHNKAHNRTRTLTCAGVSAFARPWSRSRCTIPDLLSRAKTSVPLVGRKAPLTSYTDTLINAHEHTRVRAHTNRAH